MRQQITISKKDLEHRYRTQSTADICAHYGICTARLYKLIDAAGIKRIRAAKKKRRSDIVVELTE